MEYRRLLKAYGAWGLASLLAVVFLVESWVSARLPGPMEISGADRVMLVLGGLALVLSVAWRRRLPLLVIALAIGNLTLNFVVARGGQESLASVIAMLAGAYSVAAYISGPTAHLGLLGTVVLVPLVELQDPRPDWSFSDILLLSLIFGTPWIAGRAMRFSRERERILQNLAVELDGQLEERQSTAVAEERARIARELHDVVAHAITVMILQARGGRRSLASAPKEAAEAFDAIESTASQALMEMRRLLGLLQQGDETASLTPHPSLRHIGDLVKQVDDAGLPVDLMVEGAPIPLSPGIDLSSYRIIQEALTNSLKHAGPTTASVTVRYKEKALELEVADDGSGPDESPVEGRGLLGMRERVSLYGGELFAGPGSGGGFVVRARIPLDGGLA